MSVQISPISPLPRRLQPRPWEDLLSFLARNAKHMGYTKLTQITQPELYGHHLASSQLPVLTEQADYAFLSALLLVSEETLYQMTLHRFSAPFAQLDLFPVVKIPHKSDQCLRPHTSSYQHPINRPRIEKGLLYNFFLPKQTTQICSSCLQEGVAYDRLYWKARYLLACHKHAVLLQRHCSTCHKPIPLDRLVPTSCPFCQKDYTPNIPLDSELAFLLCGDRLTLQALGVPPGSGGPLTDSSQEDPRAVLPPEQYMALMRAMCISLHGLQSFEFQTFLPPAISTFLARSNMTTHLHPDRVPPLQVTAIHWIFSAWPDHFFTFLAALEQWRPHAKKKHAFYNFPDHFLLGRRATEAFRLLSSAYKQYQALPYNQKRQGLLTPPPQPPTAPTQSRFSQSLALSHHSDNNTFPPTDAISLGVSTPSQPQTPPITNDTPPPAPAPVTSLQATPPSQLHVAPGTSNTSSQPPLTPRPTNASPPPPMPSLQADAEPALSFF